MINLNKILVFLIGFSMWFPAVAFINIGNGTGIQFVVLFAILFVFLNFNKHILLNIKALLWLLSFLIFIGIQILYILNIYNESSFYLKGVLFFSFSYIILFTGYLIYNNGLLNQYLIGFVASGKIQVLFGLLQFVFWKLLRIDFPLIVGIHNNISFGVNPDYVNLGRCFAFCPEPSIFFIHLIVLFTIFWIRKKYLWMFLTILAMFGTQSFGLIFVLPFTTLFILYYLNKINFKTMVFIFFILIISFSTLIYFKSIKYDLADIGHSVQLNTKTDIVSRVSAIEASVSFLSRLNSIKNAITMISQRPFIGWGVQSEGQKNFLKSNSIKLEENIGINSFFLNLPIWFGIGSLSLVYVVARFLIYSLDNSTKVQIISILIATSFSLSFYHIYIIWFYIGVTLVALHFKNKTSSRIL